MSALELRAEINKALAGTYVQMVTVKGLTVTLTTMESTKASLLNTKVGTFLHLIPGTVSVCNMCTCSGNGTQERAVQDLLCLVDLYLVYLI